MKILAVEFSSEQRNVAVAVDGRVFPGVSETAPRVTRAFALIEQALKNAALERERIECIAIGLGPGSYTGIRAAIALAQGWQLAASVKLLGVSSVDCLAAQAQALGWTGKINFIIDAQREEVYHARYEISADACREISALRLATVENVRSTTAPGEIIAGPEVRRWFADGRELFPGAQTLAHAASRRNDFVPGEKLEPIYLREANFVKAPPPRNL